MLSVHHIHLSLIFTCKLDLSKSFFIHIAVDLLAQAGMRWNIIWAGTRLRYSLNMPNALDAYLRAYTGDITKSRNNFFFGAVFTSDASQHTVGGQLGFESRFIKKEEEDKHFLIASIGVSKSLTRYAYGDNLIYDFKLTYTWQRSMSKDCK